MNKVPIKDFQNYIVTRTSQQTDFQSLAYPTERDLIRVTVSYSEAQVILITPCMYDSNLISFERQTTLNQRNPVICHTRLFPPTLRHLLQASKTSVTNLLLTETNSASLSLTSNSTPCQDDQVSPRVSASTTPGLNTNRRLRSSPPSPLTLVPPHHSPSQDGASFSSGFTDHLKGGGRNWEGYLESEAVVLQIHSCLSALWAISRPLGLLSTIAELGQEESLLMVPQFFWHS